MTKGFGVTPIKKWHITKALEGSKAFEMANKTKQIDNNPNARYFPVIVQSNTRKFELIVGVIKTKRDIGIVLATVTKETILSRKDVNEITKEFSKGLSRRHSSKGIN
jgi:hypothetical protein